MGSLFPILQFDDDHQTIIQPSAKNILAQNCTKAVACFFGDVLEKLANEGEITSAGWLGSEMGRIPVYLTTTNPPILAYLAGQGAPFSVQLFEKMVAAGVRQFVAISGCGALIENLLPGEILVIQSAIRDEGTSYHYLPPGREVFASKKAVCKLRELLSEEQIPYRIAKTWSTDAIYRETPARRQTRIQEGCQIVEMEAAALYAAAQFRGVDIVQVAYAGDLVIPGRWDKRGWDDRFEDREKLFHLAVDALTKWKD